MLIFFFHKRFPSNESSHNQTFMCKFSLSKNDSFFVPFSKYNNVVMSNRSYKLLKDLALLHTDAFAF